MNDRVFGQSSTIHSLISASRQLVFVLALHIVCGWNGQRAQGDDLFALDPQPEALPFGTVHVGSVVEASVAGLVNERFDDGIEVVVTPPPFARVIQSHVRTRSFGERESILEVVIEIDTSVEGEHSGALHLQLGDCHVDVPVSVNVVPLNETAPRILMVPTPIDSNTTDDPEHFTVWLEMVEDVGINVSYLTVDRFNYVLRDIELSNYDVVVIADAALVFGENKDFELLQEFAEGGGRVIVAADRNFARCVEKANRLLVPNGLEMKDITAPSVSARDSSSRIDVEASTIDVAGDDIADDPFTNGVEQLGFLQASPITLLDDSRAKFLVTAPPFPGQGYVAVTSVGDGEIVGIGKTLLWNWISSDDERRTDNGILLRNLLTLPVGVYRD